MDSEEGKMEFNILGESYPLPHIEADNQTKEHILINATLLFAKQGYAAVSMRDIASTIGIKPASLYNHFDSKETLWKEVIDHARDLYVLYFKSLDETLERAETFVEVLDTMFLEPRKLANVFTCYAFSLIQVSQFRDEYAGGLFNNLLLKYSIDFLQGWFDKCVAKNLVAPFDTKTIATVFMHSVLIGLNVNVQQCLGRAIPYDPSVMFADLQRFILEAVGSGKNNSPEK